MHRLLLFLVQCLVIKESFGMPPGNGFLPKYPKNEVFAGYNGNAMASELNAINLGNNIASAASNLAGSGIQNPAINNIQVSPVISEVVPSLQYGDVNMAGELPIGGTIKVSGCFPVYGMVAVDGNVPSSGTAVVAESFGNQVADIVSKCASQYFNN